MNNPIADYEDGMILAGGPDAASPDPEKRALAARAARVRKIVHGFYIAVNETVASSHASYLLDGMERHLNDYCAKNFAGSGPKISDLSILWRIIPLVGLQIWAGTPKEPFQVPFV